ncbi:hypothetical protein [[Eubacterium] cellulosolvens]
MAYIIISVPNENKNKVKEVLRDDIISRQSITTRDASALKIEKEAQLILIEGEDNALERAKELFKDLGTLEEGQVAEDIYAKFKKDEEGAAAGVGFIFGD